MPGSRREVAVEHPNERYESERYESERYESERYESERHENEDDGTTRAVRPA